MFNGQAGNSFNEALTALDADIDFNYKGAAATALAGKTYDSAELTIYTVTAIALLIGIASVFIVLICITTPLQRMNGTMGVIANGNLDEKIESTDRNDEIGDVARALQVFTDAALRVCEMGAEQKEQEGRTAAQRKADMIKLAGDFEAAVGEIVDMVSSASTELEASAGTLTAPAARPSN